jgi:alpha-beta hydrolase superfamily lysophospholipase
MTSETRGPDRELVIASGGERLHGEWFAPALPARGLAVIVHGYAEHCGRYREVAEVTTSAGFAAVAFDLRGHGRSTGQRGHCDRFSQFLDDLDAAVSSGRQLLGAPHLPLVVVAHSHGALVALVAVARQRLAPAALVLSSPFLALRMHVSPIKTGLGRMASRLLPRLSLSTGVSVGDLTSDIARQEARRVDKLCHTSATARWFTEATAAQREVRAAGSAIAVPSLWLVGADDAIAEPQASFDLARTLAVPAQYHSLPGFKHEVWNEVDRSSVFQTMRQFLGEVATPVTTTTARR